jgi:hypothetical protein
VITGFNTDIVHGGTTYHVQTEDKGLETPIILSLVYVGGAILAAKRAPYDDLIASGFDEGTLTERLQRQHKLICAAIKAGRVDDLKRIGHAESAEKSKKAEPKRAEPKRPEPKRAEPKRSAPPPAPTPATPPPPPVQAAPEVDFMLTEDDIVATPPPPPPTADAAPPPSILDLLTEAHALIEPHEDIIRVPVLEVLPPVEPITQSVTSPAADSFLAQEAEVASGALYLKLLDDEGEFRAGQFATIKIYTGRGRYGRSAVREAEVTVKVLGTTFRPLLLSTKTNDEGVAVIRAILPRFTSGRAAILIRAVAPEGDVAELRRIIHQA